MEKDPNIAVASGLTYIRGYPYQPMLFKNVEDGLTVYDDFKKKTDKDGILRDNLGAVGFSCALINTKYLKDLKPPYCITGSRNTEDVYLCCRVREQYPEATIVCDTTINTAHIVDKYLVNDNNRKQLMKFEEVINEKSVNKSDRGLDYAKKVQESVKSRVRRQPRKKLPRAQG